MPDERLLCVDAAESDGNCCLSDGSALGLGAAADRDVDGASLGSYRVATRLRALKPRPEEREELARERSAARCCDGAGLDATGLGFGFGLGTEGIVALRSLFFLSQIDVFAGAGGSAGFAAGAGCDGVF